MTRKKLKKLLMGYGWSRKDAEYITNTLKWLRGIANIGPVVTNKEMYDLITDFMGSLERKTYDKKTL